MHTRLLGGIFLILSGICGFVVVTALFIGSTSVGGMPGMDAVPGMADAASGILKVCGGIFAVFSIVALLGGVVALMGKMWGLSLVGGILGLFTIGPLFLGSIFGLIGLILIAMSKEEYGPQPAYPPQYLPPQYMPPGVSPPPGYLPPPGQYPPQQPPQQPPQSPPS